MFVCDMYVNGVRGDQLPQEEEDLGKDKLEVYGINWQGLRDDNILHSQAQNNSTTEGSSSWVGHTGPPPDLSQVIVQPPVGTLTEEEATDLYEAHALPATMPLVCRTSVLVDGGCASETQLRRLCLWTGARHMPSLPPMPRAKPVCRASALAGHLRSSNVCTRRRWVRVRPRRSSDDSGSGCEAHALPATDAQSEAGVSGVCARRTSALVGRLRSSAVRIHAPLLACSHDSVRLGARHMPSLPPMPRAKPVCRASALVGRLRSSNVCARRRWVRVRDAAWTTPPLDRCAYTHLFLRTLTIVCG
ncbi:hypothetical protein K438DRAFT_2028647 [Mycena galopus ATCC 62051]|nr:hypothetical protein K438DRAFT_2028647 [Mycena galopus ATCC 62051]